MRQLSFWDRSSLTNWAARALNRSTSVKVRIFSSPHSSTLENTQKEKKIENVVTVRGTKRHENGYDQ